MISERWKSYVLKNGQVWIGPRGCWKYSMSPLGYEFRERFQSSLWWIAVHTPPGRAILALCGCVYPGIPRG